MRHCALGKFLLSGTNVAWQGRITGIKTNSTLENNISIDSNPGEDNQNGKDGKTVAAALFKQRYFENTLGWDFDTVWRWDDKEDRPELRSVGLGTSPQYAQSTAPEADMADLLHQQMRANIWL